MFDIPKRWFILIWVAVIALAIFFRLYHLGQKPPSLYWEEVALGYDAYSILQTGKDFHGTSWPVVAFESFGDWKPSLYFYAIVPFISVLGLNEWAVRLPSALAGISIVVGTGFLAARVLRDRSSSSLAILLGSSVAAISPWAIIFSRGGWEANLATALILWGVISFWTFIDLNIAQLAKRFSLKRERKVMLWLLLSVTCFSLSTYAYHSARLVAPALGLALVGIWFKLFLPGSGSVINHAQVFVKKNTQYLLAALCLSVLLLLPLIVSLSDITTQQRFNETNIFADLALLQKSQALQQAAGNTLVSKVLFHRYVIYSQEILKNFFSHFSVQFLFVSGDENVRHSTQFIGQLYHIEVVFLLLGGWSLFKRRRAFDVFLLLWLVMGIFPAALTKAVPHALRILVTLPVWLVLITSGIFELIESSNSVFKRLLLPKLARFNIGFIFILSLVIVSLYLWEVASFWRFYTLISPRQYAGAYNDGDKQMVMVIRDLAERNQDLPIVVMRSRGRPSVYYWFYNQVDPRRVQILNEIAAKDQGEFLAFENVTFPVKADEVKGRAIVATLVENFPAVAQKILDPLDPTNTIIKDTAGHPVWVVFIKE
jgi:hypothetical protein